MLCVCMRAYSSPCFGLSVRGDRLVTGHANGRLSVYRLVACEQHLSRHQHCFSQTPVLCHSASCLSSWPTPIPRSLSKSRKLADVSAHARPITGVAIDPRAKLVSNYRAVLLQGCDRNGRAYDSEYSRGFCVLILSLPPLCPPICAPRSPLHVCMERTGRLRVQRLQVACVVARSHCAIHLQSRVRCVVSSPCPPPGRAAVSCCCDDGVQS